MTKREEIRALRDEVAGLRDMLGIMQVQLTQVLATRQTVIVGDPLPQPAPFPQPWVGSPNICQTSQTTPKELASAIAWHARTSLVEVH